MVDKCLENESNSCHTGMAVFDGDIMSSEDVLKLAHAQSSVSKTKMGVTQRGSFERATLAFSKVWDGVGKDYLELGRRIGGRVEHFMNSSNGLNVVNPSSIRISYVLNSLGHKIPELSVSLLGADGGAYLYLHEYLYWFVLKLFGRPEVTGCVGRNGIAGRKGLLLFDLEWDKKKAERGRAVASGFATLWDGSRCLDRNLFPCRSPFIDFWELDHREYREI